MGGLSVSDPDAPNPSPVSRRSTTRPRLAGRGGANGCFAMSVHRRPRAGPYWGEIAAPIGRPSSPAGASGAAGGTGSSGMPGSGWNIPSGATRSWSDSSR